MIVHNYSYFLPLYISQHYACHQHWYLINRSATCMVYNPDLLMPQAATCVISLSIMNVADPNHSIVNIPSCKVKLNS